MRTLRWAGRALVVDGEAAPLLGHGAVVDQRDERARRPARRPGPGRPRRPCRRGRPRGRGRTPRGTARRRRRRRSRPASRPDGAGRASSLVSAWRATRRACSSTSYAVEQLAADRVADGLVAGLHAGVAGGHASAPRSRVRTWSSSASRPSLLATRMRRRLSAHPGAHLLDRRRPRPGRPRRPAGSSSTLARLGDGLGQHGDVVGARRGDLRVRSTTRSPPPPPRAAAAAASAAARRPASERSAVWAKPVVSPTTTRMPAPRSRPERELLDPAVVEAGRRRPACPRRTPRRSRRRSAARRRAPAGSRPRRAPVASLLGRSGCLGPAGTRLRIVPGCPSNPASSAPGRADGHRRRHRHRHALGRRRRARHAPGRRPGRGGDASPPSPATSADGETTVGMRVQLDHLAPSAVGAKVPPRPRSRRSRAAGSPSPCRSPTTAGLVAAGKVTRVVVDTRDASWRRRS